MLLHTWVPQCLRAAGLQVVETAGWTGRSHGPFPDSIAAYWHHDASPPGDSPGALNWMITNWDNASANFWVNRQGVWYCVGTGVAWHAGRQLPGMPGSFGSFGIETDQTINEVPAPAMLDSTRRGIAAMLKEMGRNGQSTYFHKTTASPVGRKQDPWFAPSSNDQANWGAELSRERINVQALIDSGAPVPKPPDGGDDVPLTDADVKKIWAHIIPTHSEFSGGKEVAVNNKAAADVIAAISTMVAREQVEQVKAIVDERVQFYVTRLPQIIRLGQGNKAFAKDSPGQDNKGTDFCAYAYFSIDGDTSGKVYEANILARTYSHVPDPATLADRKAVLDRANIHWVDWLTKVKPDDVRGFGTEFPWTPPKS